MKTKVFSVYDHKAAVYGTPFFMPNVAMAVRAFTDLVEDNRTMVSKHPEDFVLYQVGEFDDDRGVLNALDPKIDLGTASNFVKGVREPGLLVNGVEPQEVKR